jgi:hypothetical protein
MFHTYDKQVCQFNVDLAEFIGKKGSLDNLEPGIGIISKK